MKVRGLVEHWQKNATEPNTAQEYSLRLPLYDAAKIAALAEIFPALNEERILTDLLSAALDDLGESFTYVQGDEVVSHDEQGDPIYNDAGFGASFRRLSNEHAERLKKELDEAG